MSDIFLVRQPVFDRTDTAVGYELRFRDAGDGSDSFARSYLSGSFDVLRSGLPAYVRTSREQLTSRIFDDADPSSLVVLLPPTLPAEAELVELVAGLAAAGVTIGLDEFRLTRDPASPVLAYLAHATLVRIDLREQDPAALAPLVAALKRQGKRVVADHVLDADAHRACMGVGFDRFLGPHFSRPEPLPAAEIPTSTATALQLMSLARNPNTQERELERVVSADPSITFQLLRIVNSAALGGRGITSIQHALRLVGRTNLVRWLALASYTARTGKSGVDDELVRQAVQRAHFAEALAVQVPGSDRGTAFLVGLFSLLDAVFRMPLGDVLERVNLADEVKAALLDRTGRYADMLTLIESYELGLWESAAEIAGTLSVPSEKLPELYATALKWAEEHIPSPGAKLAKAG
jgi:EAL and modified HD-GYP domain-containing signal transduction protein